MAMSNSKQMFSVMRSSFTKKNVEKFVIGLMTGKERLRKIQKMPDEIRKVDLWDGKDKKPQTYDDYDDFDDDEDFEDEELASDQVQEEDDELCTEETKEECSEKEDL